MIIPKTFNVGPFTVPVEFNDTMWEETKQVGEADIGKQRIILQSPMDDLNLKCVKQAFFA